MKRLFPIAAVICLLALGTWSCKEKKKSDDIIVAKYVPDGPKEPIRMTVDKRVTPVEWLGKNYTITINRAPADSLPMLKDETGQEYVDNSVSVVIQRSDNTMFFRHLFTKNSFSSYVDASFRSEGCLENIVFHGIEDDNLKFGAVVSRPGNEDEFVPIDVKIDRNGSISISQGKLFDRDEDADSLGV